MHTIRPRSFAAGDFILGWLGEKLVATGALIPEDRHSRRIVRMSVSKQFRRQGFGRQILDHLLAIAQKVRIKKVVLETTKSWDDAIAFYRSCGFQINEYRGGSVHMSLDIESLVDAQQINAPDHEQARGR